MRQPRTGVFEDIGSSGVSSRGMSTVTIVKSEGWGSADGPEARPCLAALNNIQAVAGVVVKELYRRKDFYVLFILTALITLALGSAKFFGEAQSVRYLKEICLLL